jgi:hypothetical protein
VVVVVAVQAQGCAEDLLAVAMGLVAAQVDAVGAGLGVAAGSAGPVADLPSRPRMVRVPWTGPKVGAVKATNADGAG